MYFLTYEKGGDVTLGVLATDKASVIPLLEAEKHGCGIIYGIEMLLGQAAAQFELWTGVDAPAAVMRKAAEEFLK